MKAWIYDGPFNMHIEELDHPKLSSNSDVIVRIRAVGICGSDIHGFSGKTGRRYPGMVMGHEIAGEITEYGQDVKNLHTGQKVVVQPIIYCGECEPCRTCKTSICLNKKMLGVNMGVAGGLSEYVAVPSRNVFPISDSMPFKAASLVEPMAVGAGAAKYADLREHQNITVIGVGVIGLSIILMSREWSPNKVFAVDNNPRRLRIAEEFGAEPINLTESDPIETIFNRTSGIGSDVSIEAVGLSESVRTAMQATKAGGRVVWVGNSKQNIELDMQEVVVKAKCIQGVYCYTDDDFRRAITFIEENQEIVESFVETVVPFKDTLNLLKELSGREKEMLRAVVLTGGET